MALTLSGTTGKTNVTIGGEWSEEVAWDNPLRGLTELTVLLMITPAAPLTSGVTAGAAGGLLHNWGTTRARSSFEIRWTANTIQFQVTDGTTVRGGACTAPDTTGGVRWNIACRWAGSALGDLLKIDINGTPRTVTLLSGGGFGAIATLTPVSGGVMAPIEIGYQSMNGFAMLNGLYHDGALLSRYMTDADVTAFGTGVSPHLLEVNGHLKYVRMTTATSTGATSAPDGTAHGIVFDEWSGERYGLVAQSPYSVGAGYYQGAFGGYAITTHPAVTYSRAPVATDYATLPQRRLTQDELLRTSAGLGPRSGRVFHVPAGTITDPHGGATTFSPPTLQRAMNLAQNWYVDGGDDIAINHLTDQVESLILTGYEGKTRAPLGTATPYIHVYSDALASLPVPAIRTITMPDASSYPVLHESGRVDRSHRPLMATVQAVGANAVLSTDSGFTGSLEHARYWYFSGIHWLQGTEQNSECNTLINLKSIRQPTGTGGVGLYGWGPGEWDSHHIIFSQCLAEGDPLKDGTSTGNPLTLNGQYLAWIFGGIIDCYGYTTGEIQVISTGSAGPFHVEMNVLESLGAAGMFSGGATEVGVDNLPADTIFRRNYQVARLKDCPSEVTPYGGPGWVVNTTSAGEIQFVSGPFDWFGSNGMGPLWGGYMWQPATGKAVQILLDAHRTSSPTTIYSLGNWPGGAATNITVFFQTPHAIYNSGTTWPLGQCTTHNSITVDFAEPIPATVDPNGAEPVYFYQNNGHWTDVGTRNEGNPPKNFGGIADTPCPRRRVISIASNRLSCTLDQAYGQAITHNYSLVHCDGVKKAAVGHQKSNFEMKNGRYTLFEGNVTRLQGGERQYPVDQGPGVAVGQITITGDHVRWTNTLASVNADWFRGLEQQFRLFGKPWAYFCLTNGTYSFSATILIDQFDSDGLGATLVPGTSASKSGAGVPLLATGQGAAVNYIMNWMSGTEKVWRYNIFDNCGQPSMFTGGQSGPEVIKSQHLHTHDNLYTQYGKRMFATMDFGAVGSTAAAMPTGASVRPTIIWGLTNDGSNSTEHWHHNTLVHCQPLKYAHNVFGVAAGGDPGDVRDPKSTDVDLNDNIVDGVGQLFVFTPGETGINAILGGAGIGTLGYPENIPAIWTPPYSVARSIFIGTGAQAAVADPLFAGPFPDNAALLSRNSVGFANAPELANQLDILKPLTVDPLNYVLQHIYTTGTATIPATGTAVTFSGPLPATIVAGQFFVVPGTADVPKRIQSVNNAAGTCVLVGAYSATNSYSASPFAITFKGTASDGGDPGGNMPMVAQMTAGVVPGAPVVEEPGASGIHFGGTDGNQNIVIGGYWNPPFTIPAWVNPLAGLTAFSLALDLVPDAGFLTVAGFRIAQQHQASTFGSTFQLEHAKDFGGGRLVFTVTGAAGNRQAVTETAMVAGQHCRLVVRWRASDGAMGIWVNGTEITIPQGGAAVTALTGSVGVALAAPPIELGAASMLDHPPVPGVYKNWALWGRYLTDAECINFGLGNSPDTIAATSRIEWVKGTAIAPISPAGTFDPDGTHPKHGHILGEWTSTNYGTLTTTYDYSGPQVPYSAPYQGAFGDWENVAPAVGNVAPTCTITSPTNLATYAAASATVNLSGTATDDVAVTSVTWANDRGGSGTATGTATWSITGIVLQPGVNVITVTARDVESAIGTDVLTVTYSPPDTINPTVSITTPTSATTWPTAATPLTIAGVAGDNVGVTGVSWVNDRGGSGNAALTPTGGGGVSWTTASAPVALQSGANVLTVTARDAAGNTATDVLTVTYTPEVADTTDPVVTITSPTASATHATQSAALTLGGTATDNVGVFGVTWTNDRGGSGAAVMTPGGGGASVTWEVLGLVLQTGDNVLTVTAVDAAGNDATDMLTVTYTPASGLSIVETWTRANAPNTMSGEFPWVSIAGTAFGVVGNALQLEDSGNATELGYLNHDLGTSDYLVTATIEEFAPGADVMVIGPCARMQGNGSFTSYSMNLFVSAAGDFSVSIQRFMAGAQQQIGDAVTVVPHAGMTLGIWAEGPRIRGQFDGVTIIDQQDPTGILTGQYLGLQGAATVGSRVRVASIGTVGESIAPSGPIRVPITVRAPMTVRVPRTV